jgi:hypothetical protein
MGRARTAGRKSRLPFYPTSRFMFPHAGRRTPHEFRRRARRRRPRASEQTERWVVFYSRMQNELSQLSHRYSPTLGAHQLAAAPGTLRAKAAALGVTERSITNYQAGARVPTDAVQGKALSAFGITRGAWSQSAASAAPTSPSAEPTSSESSTAPPLDGEAPSSSVLPGSLAEIQVQIQRLTVRRESGELSERALLETEKLLAALNRDASKLRGVTSDVLVGSDAWAELQAAIILALEPWPDAMRAVAVALRAGAQ